ncbi:MAG: ABC transporter ATP-binding protein [Bacteroidetes bacterium QS_9_68_14]|nr:MAG: ABC transporter ATP-binding protein [Bacteroidetes bacterium QS_9_68_14]
MKTASPTNGRAADESPRAPLLRVRGLSKAYREGDTERTIFEDLGLSVAEGAFAVLMGRSGAGKSTLLNLISGIDRPDAGTVAVGGTELTALSEKERTQFRRRHIGFVFQAFNLIPTLTALENVLLPLELSGGAGEREEKRARRLLGEVGLEDRAESFPDRLSGGEQQRVATARALAHRPRLVLADEPTGNLDYETGEQVLGVLTALARESETTLLVATHDRSALPHADRVLDLEGGRLSEREGVGKQENGRAGKRAKKAET